MLKPRNNISVRDFPYPYKAFVAVCSDLDETPGQNIYFETSRFLNTTEETAMGAGVGLEVGNTIYFDMPKGHFSYWNADEAGREKLCALMQSGHIDCLHSIGDTASTRFDAFKAYQELTKRNCALKVWIDHAIAPTNLGKDIMRGGGDIPGHPAYHSDLLAEYGIQYVWRGRVSSLMGQNGTVKPGGIWTGRHPITSSKTLAKELVKHGLAMLQPHGKYGLHRGNKLLREVTLSNGEVVHEFIRANPHWGGVSCCDTGKGIGEVLTSKFLEALIHRRATSIVYTHLGKLLPTQEGPIFPETAHQGFRLLASYKARGEILVSTTRRLLDYNRVIKNLEWSVHETSSIRTISVKTKENRAALQGLTFYVDDGKQNQICINNTPTETILNSPDETGKQSVSIPWKPLSFPI